MPFGHCNTPSTFQTTINAVLHDLLDKGVIAYNEDILIDTETEREHVQLVQKIPPELPEAKMCVSIKKSSLHVSEVEYLGYHISAEEITMSLDKVIVVGE